MNQGPEMAMELNKNGDYLIYFLQHTLQSPQEENGSINPFHIVQKHVPKD